MWTPSPPWPLVSNHSTAWSSWVPTAPAPMYLPRCLYHSPGMVCGRGTLWISRSPRLRDLLRFPILILLWWPQHPEATPEGTLQRTVTVASLQGLHRRWVTRSPPESPDVPSTVIGWRAFGECGTWRHQYGATSSRPQKRRRLRQTLVTPDVAVDTKLRYVDAPPRLNMILKLKRLQEIIWYKQVS
jgi:hypothetical protein